MLVTAPVMAVVAVALKSPIAALAKVKPMHKHLAMLVVDVEATKLLLLLLRKTVVDVALKLPLLTPVQQLKVPQQLQLLMPELQRLMQKPTRKQLDCRPKLTESQPKPTTRRLGCKLEQLVLVDVQTLGLAEMPKPQRPLRSTHLPLPDLAKQLPSLRLE